MPTLLVPNHTFELSGFKRRNDDAWATAHTSQIPVVVGGGLRGPGVPSVLTALYGEGVPVSPLEPTLLCVLQMSLESLPRPLLVIFKFLSNSWDAQT